MSMQKAQQALIRAQQDLRDAKNRIHELEKAADASEIREATMATALEVAMAAVTESGVRLNLKLSLDKNQPTLEDKKMCALLVAFAGVRDRIPTIGIPARPLRIMDDLAAIGRRLT